jgi:hypothetical protein
LPFAPPLELLPCVVVPPTSDAVVVSAVLPLELVVPVVVSVVVPPLLLVTPPLLLLVPEVVVVVVVSTPGQPAWPAVHVYEVHASGLSVLPSHGSVIGIDSSITSALCVQWTT